jgi:hypothetical protein
MVGVYLYINDVQTPFTYMYIVYLKSEWHTYLHRQVVLPRFFFGLIARLLCSYFLSSVTTALRFMLNDNDMGKTDLARKAIRCCSHLPFLLFAKSITIKNAIVIIKI